MTCRTLRWRQVSTWAGSATTVGAVPFGFRPGRPLGRSPMAGEDASAPPSSLVLLIVGPPARWCGSSMTLAFSNTDLKHLFDTRRKCRTPAIRLYRSFVRSNVILIEQEYYRTVIRAREAGNERDER